MEEEKKDNYIIFKPDFLVDEVEAAEKKPIWDSNNSKNKEIWQNVKDVYWQKKSKNTFKFDENEPQPNSNIYFVCIDPGFRNYATLLGKYEIDEKNKVVKLYIDTKLSEVRELLYKDYFGDPLLASRLISNHLDRFPEKYFQLGIVEKQYYSVRTSFVGHYLMLTEFLTTMKMHLKKCFVQNIRKQKGTGDKDVARKIISECIVDDKDEILIQILQNHHLCDCALLMKNYLVSKDFVTKEFEFQILKLEE